MTDIREITRYGERGCPWRIPALCFLQLNLHSISFNLNRGFTWKDFRRLMILSDVPSLWMACMSFSWSTLSNTFSQSRNTKRSLSPVAAAWSCNLLVMNNGCAVFSFFLQPNCVSDICHLALQSVFSLVWQHIFYIRCLGVLKSDALVVAKLQIRASCLILINHLKHKCCLASIRCQKWNTTTNDELCNLVGLPRSYGIVLSKTSGITSTGCNRSEIITSSIILIRRE